MNQQLLFLMSLVKALRLCADQSNSESANLPQGGLNVNAGIDIYRTTAIRLNGENDNAGYVCALIITDKTGRVNFPYLIVDKTPDAINMEVNNIYNSYAAQLATFGTPNIYVISNNKLSNQMTSAMATMSTDGTRAYPNLFQNMFGGDCEKILANIVFSTLTMASSEIVNRGITAQNIYSMNFQTENYILSSGQMFFDNGMILMPSFQFDQATNNWFVIFGIGLNHSILRVAKNDYI